MRRLFLALPIAVAALIACFAPLERVQALVAVNFDAPQHGGAAYVGPCDLVTCAEAWSPARAMTTAYAGNLFQIVRASDSSTLNIGQSSHAADLSGVYNHCKGTECWVSKIYAQIQGSTNDLVAANNGMASVNGACNNTTFVCAPTFLIDPVTGKPVIRTTYPTGFALASDGNSTGITSATGPISQWIYGRNEGWTDCCGTPGLSHAFNEANTVGSYFGLWNTYGNADNTYFSASTNIAQAVGNSWESADRDGADIALTTKGVIGSMGTWDGSGSTNTIKIYANSATPIYTTSPPCPTVNVAPCNYGVNAINVGKHVHWGFGGDTSQIDKVVYDVLLANSVLSGSDFTAIKSNSDTFYAAAAPTCYGTAGMNFQWSPVGTHDTFEPYYNALYAYGLYQMRADYYGPIADLRDALGTVNTYSPSSSGCVIDTAAATFCAANPPCAVAKLYNQGTFAPNSKMHHDSTSDLVQATTASQPSVTFASLNGKPTMHFSGSQFLKSGLISVTMVPTIISAVARRTGSFTSYQEILSTYPDFPTILGYANSADTVNTYDGSSSPTSTATDSHWHSVVAEADNTGGGAGRLYVDNAAGGTEGLGWSTNNFHISMGAGTDGTTQPCTCDIAEAEFMTNYKPGSTTNNKVGYDPQHTNIFTVHQTTWGTLPN